jgi:hypothetical protein
MQSGQCCSKSAGLPVSANGIVGTELIRIAPIRCRIRPKHHPALRFTALHPEALSLVTNAS